MDFIICQYAVHSPYDLPVENMGFTEMMKQDEIEAIYAVVETVADSQVRVLSPKQRKCLFPDEPSKMSTVRDNYRYFSVIKC